MRDIDNIEHSEVWERIDSWDNYHRDMVVWLHEESGTEMDLDRWAYSYARFEIAVEINRENGIWERPSNVVDLNRYRSII